MAPLGLYIRAPGFRPMTYGPWLLVVERRHAGPVQSECHVGVTIPSRHTLQADENETAMVDTERLDAALDAQAALRAAKAALRMIVAG